MFPITTAPPLCVSNQWSSHSFSIGSSIHLPRNGRHSILSLYRKLDALPDCAEAMAVERRRNPSSMYSGMKSRIVLRARMEGNPSLHGSTCSSEIMQTRSKHSCNLRDAKTEYSIAISPKAKVSSTLERESRESIFTHLSRKLGLSLATIVTAAMVVNLSPTSDIPVGEIFNLQETILPTMDLAMQKSFFPDNIWGFLRVGPAHANGLLRVPPEELRNTYYLVRAGESEKESQGILYTNPVGKTSMDSGLSAKGKLQTLAAARELKRIGACEDSCWVWPSITQRAYQTAEIISAINFVPYSRIVPEYSFLDARSVGAFEGKGLDALDEVHKLDAVSQRLRPPPYYDGTPNESVADVLVRVVQLMSILETQYFGDTIVIVSPDSDNLSVLHAALTGLDLRSHTSLGFAPGEVRMVQLSEDRGPTPNFSGYISCPKPPNCN